VLVCLLLFMKLSVSMPIWLSRCDRIIIDGADTCYLLPNPFRNLSKEEASWDQITHKKMMNLAILASWLFWLFYSNSILIWIRAKCSNQWLWP
jgi:hypothetical protein